MFLKSFCENFVKISAKNADFSEISATFSNQSEKNHDFTEKCKKSAIFEFSAAQKCDYLVDFEKS